MKIPKEIKYCIIASVVIVVGLALLIWRETTLLPANEAMTTADWMIESPVECSTPGCNCKYGHDLTNGTGCNRGTGCNSWNGSTIHPLTKTDLSANVSLACGNVGSPNALHAEWTPMWKKDPTRSERGVSCISQTNGYGCRSGLCLKEDTPTLSEPVSYRCA